MCRARSSAASLSSLCSVADALRRSRSDRRDRGSGGAGSLFGRLGRDFRADASEQSETGPSLSAGDGSSRRCLLLLLRLTYVPARHISPNRHRSGDAARTTRNKTQKYRLPSRQTIQCNAYTTARVHQRLIRRRTPFSGRLCAPASLNPPGCLRANIAGIVRSGGNYPNPFRQTTRLVFDLPLTAHVTVEVMDVTGRRVLTAPSVGLAAGWEHRIELSGTTLSSGLYLYRLIAASPEGISTHVGRFVRISMGGWPRGRLTAGMASGAVPGASRSPTADPAYGKWRRNCAGGYHRALVAHRGFLVHRASASLSFDEGSVEKWFGLIGQILAELGRGSGFL